MASFLSSISSRIEYARKGAVTAPVDRTLHPLMINPPEGKDMQPLIQQAKEEYKMTERPNEFHVAVVGAQGVGKSSLINGLRNFADDQPGAAPVGKPCTSPTPYRGGFFELIVFWDFPGAGVGHPSMTYYYDKKLYAFDAILVASDRFHKVDMEIAKAVVLHRQRQVLFVRTKADLLVKKELEQGKHAHIIGAIKRVHADVQASFREALRVAGLSNSFNSFNEVLVISTKHYLNPQVYTFYEDDDEEDEDDDYGLKMDEEKLVNYLTSVTRNRLRRTRSNRYTPINTSNQ